MEETLEKMRVTEDTAKEAVSATIARIVATVDKVIRDSDEQRKQAEEYARAAALAAIDAEKNAEADIMLAEAVAAEKSAYAMALSEVETIKALERVKGVRKQTEAEIQALIADAEAQKAQVAADTKAAIEDARVARQIAAGFAHEASLEVEAAKAEAEKVTSQYDTLCKTIDEQVMMAVARADAHKQEIEASIKKEEEKVEMAKRKAAEAEEAANKTVSEAKHSMEAASQEAADVLAALRERVHEEAKKAEELVLQASQAAAQSAAHAQSRVSQYVQTAAAAAEEASHAAAPTATTTPAPTPSAEDAYRLALAQAVKESKEAEKVAASLAAAREAQRKADAATFGDEEEDGVAVEDEDSSDDESSKAAASAVRSAKAEASYLDALASVFGFGGSSRSQKLAEEEAAANAAKEEKKLLKTRPMRVLHKRREAVIAEILKQSSGDNADETRALIEALEAKLGAYAVFTHFLGPDHPLVASFSEAAIALQDKHLRSGKAVVKYPLDPGTGLPLAKPTEAAVEPADKKKAEAMKESLMGSEEAQSQYLEALRKSMHERSLSKASVDAIVPLPAVDDEQLSKDVNAIEQEKELEEQEEEADVDAHFSPHIRRDPRFYSAASEKRRRAEAEAAASGSAKNDDDKLKHAGGAVSTYANVLSSIYGIVGQKATAKAAPDAAAAEQASAATAALEVPAPSPITSASAESAYLAALKQQRSAAAAHLSPAPAVAPAVSAVAEPDQVAPAPATASTVTTSGSGASAYVASIANLFGLGAKKENKTPVAHASASKAVDAHDDEKVLVPEFWIRVVYNGQPLTLPGQTSTFTPLESFRSLIASHIPEDYEKECGGQSPLSPEIPRMPVLPVLPEAAVSLRAVFGAAASKKAQQQEPAVDKAVLEKLAEEIERRVIGSRQQVSAAEVNAAAADSMASRLPVKESFKLGGEAMTSDDEDKARGSAVAPSRRELLK
jgi:hypothetical protein